MKIIWLFELMGLLLFIRESSGESLSLMVQQEIDKMILDIQNEIDKLVKKNDTA